MKKPVRHAISVIISKEGMTLFAKRSAHKSSYPLAWSLPSHFMAEGEKPAETVRRIGKDKLGVRLKIGKLINEGESDRGDFTLFMHDFLATIVSGEPHIVSDDYTKLRYSEPVEMLNSITLMGDCCRLYKKFLEI